MVDEQAFDTSADPPGPGDVVDIPEDEEPEAEDTEAADEADEDEPEPDDGDPIV